jgi:hypothetical protein
MKAAGIKLYVLYELPDLQPKEHGLNIESDEQRYDPYCSFIQLW